MGSEKHLKNPRVIWFHLQRQSRWVVAGEGNILKEQGVTAN